MSVASLLPTTDKVNIYSLYLPPPMLNSLNEYDGYKIYI